MYEYRASVIRVVDGDTVDLRVDLGLGVSLEDRFRLYGINAPEMRGPERPEGLRSTQALTELIGGHEVIVNTYKDRKGKYGRYLATIRLDNQNVNAWLVEEGLARPADY